ncbi:MAG: hypothetical protein ACE5OZ_14045 [Candidatus Heimdallarchaeota archaeon]
MDRVDEEEIATRAHILATKCKILSKLSQRAWKILLLMYELQQAQAEPEKWTGINVPQLAQFLDVDAKRANLNRLMNKLMDINYVDEVKHVSAVHAGIKLYRLTDVTLKGIEETLEAQDEPLPLVKSSLPLAEFQKFAGRADTYNFLTQAVAICYNWIDEDQKEDLNLYILSTHLGVNPRQLLEEIRPYVTIKDENQGKYPQPILQLDLGTPVFSHFSYNCNDWVICNLLCRICHRTTVDTTHLGHEMLVALAGTIPNLSVIRPRFRTIRLMAFWIASIQVLALYLFSLVNTTIESLLFWLVTLSVVTIFLVYFVQTRITAMAIPPPKEDIFDD